MTYCVLGSWHHNTKTMVILEIVTLQKAIVGRGEAMVSEVQQYTVYDCLWQQHMIRCTYCTGKYRNVT